MEKLQNEEVIEKTEEEQNWCVYMHINIHNNKVYIGITNDIKQRWQKQGSKYKAKNKDGTYKQQAFANALMQYSDWDNDWKHEIVSTCLTWEEACEKEVELIAQYRSNVSRWHDDAGGYNMTDGGDGTVGHIHSEETKEKMSIKAKERYANPENRYWLGKHRDQETRDKISRGNKGKLVGDKNPNYGKPGLSGEKNPNYGNHTPTGPRPNSPAIAQYTLDGKRVAIYPSSFYAQKATGISASNIWTCCLHTYKIIGGYMWRLLSECDAEQIEPYKNTIYKSVVQLSLDEELIATYLSIKDASQETHILASGIIRCCQGKHKKAGGFKWMYKEDYEKQLKEQTIQND